jgi:catechol 2,3-dioxygenase-like lactoylglutathione lyase family enzyme
MKRLHLHASVPDLDQSIRFYESQALAAMEAAAKPATACCGAPVPAAAKACR